MKLSSGTISILKNYATIHQSLLIKAGNRISTQDGEFPTLLSRATVEEEFPVDVAIYDLHQFLATIALMGECDVTFGKKSVVFKGSKNQSEYFYCEPTLLKGASEKVLRGSEIFSCTLSERDITMALKAAAVFSSPMLSFVREDGAATLRVGDFKTPSSNNFQLDLGLSTSGMEFNFRVPVESIKIIPESYNVQLAAAGTAKEAKFIHFSSTTRDLQYWLAVDPSSTASD